MAILPKFDGDDLSQHSFSEALIAASRVFSSSDTKWPDFLLQIAQRQLLDDLIQLSLHLRRTVEASSRRMTTSIVNMPLGIARDFSDYETDLWNAVNRIVHHHKLTPIIFTQDDFYSAGSKPMRGHLIADIEVTSDRGAVKINVAGLAVACVNELGIQSETPKRVFN